MVFPLPKRRGSERMGRGDPTEMAQGSTDGSGTDCLPAIANGNAAGFGADRDSPEGAV